MSVLHAYTLLVAASGHLLEQPQGGKSLDLELLYEITSSGAIHCHECGIDLVMFDDARSSLKHWLQLLAVATP